MVNRARMFEQLVLHEGLKLKRYKCTAGKWTIGVGYNYEDRGLEAAEKICGRKIDPAEGITKDEAVAICNADIDSYERRLAKAWPHYNNLSEVRQRVALDMFFNMGGRLATFKETRKAAERGDHGLVAYNMMKSLWSKQVGDGPGKRYDRAERLAEMWLTDKDYTK